MTSISQARRGLRARTAAGLGSALVIAACASTPPPTAQLQAAEQAISNAERTEAGRYAATELSEARTKLASANNAVQDKEMIAASQLADESRAAAQLASAKTASVKARAVNDEMKTSTGTLIDEMQRNSGEQK
jgi:DNA gyrase inhibitor GyrI